MSLLVLVSSWLPVILWAGIIFYLSGIPGLSSGLGIWDWIFRKIAHVMEFGILTGLLVRAMRNTMPAWKIERIFMWSGALAFLYACSDEFHQMFVPQRGPSIHDVFIDVIGIVLAIIIMKRCQNREKECTVIKSI